MPTIAGLIGRSKRAAGIGVGTLRLVLVTIPRLLLVTIPRLLLVTLPLQILWLLSPRTSLAALAEIRALLVTRRDLVRELTLREIAAAHAGHGLGPVWVYLQPLVVVGIYLLIFGFVLGSRIAQGADFPGDFPSYILVGLVPWLVTQAAMLRASGALLANVNLVKQVVFPIETLPLAAIFAATVPYWPAAALVLVYKGVAAGGFGEAFALLPVVLLLHAMLLVGIGFLLAGLTAFVRDLREVIGVLCLVAMYLTPAIYLPEWMPRQLQPLIYMNPFSYMTWVYQDTLFFGEIRHPVAWGIFAAMSIASLTIGYRVFRRLKPYYGNVL